MRGCATCRIVRGRVLEECAECARLRAEAQEVAAEMGRLRALGLPAAEFFRRVAEFARGRGYC